MVEKTTTLTVKDGLIGRKIGNCRIVQRIGSGGMGTVYRAEHEGLGKAVAIKVLGRTLMGNEEAVARFVREARTAAKLDHPHVVQVHDVGAVDDFCYIVMQFVEGRSLDVMLKEKKALSVSQALAVTRHVASALAAAHQLGIVHRDIKPANILISKDGRVKVADFGLARGSETGEQISSTGQILGTPAYMSPEQAEGRTTDARSDLYSLGCTLYHLLTGQRPFEGHAPLQTVLRQIKEEPAAIESLAPATPPALCALVRRMMAKVPASRPATAEALLAEIDALGVTPAPARRLWLWALAAAAVVGLGLGAWAMVPGAKPAEPVAVQKPVEPPKPPPLSVITTAHGVRIIGMREAIEKIAEPAERAEAADLAKTLEAFYDACAAKDVEKLKEFTEGGDIADRFGQGMRLVKDRALTLTQVEVTGFVFETRLLRRTVAPEGSMTLVGGPNQSLTQPARSAVWAKRGDRWVALSRPKAPSEK